VKLWPKIRDADPSPRFSPCLFFLAPPNASIFHSQVSINLFVVEYNYIFDTYRFDRLVLAFTTFAVSPSFIQGPYPFPLYKFQRNLRRHLEEILISSHVLDLQLRGALL
jgi:hypothetical protein